MKQPGQPKPSLVSEFASEIMRVYGQGFALSFSYTALDVGIAMKPRDDFVPPPTWREVLLSWPRVREMLDEMRVRGPLLGV